MTRLTKNIIYNLLGQTLILLIGFIAIRLVFHRLGADAVGVIYFVLMMNAVLCSVLEMGICSTTVREISSHFEADPGYIHDLIRTFSLFYWGAYVLIGVVIYFLAPILAGKWANLETIGVSTATTIFRVIGVTSLLTLPQRFYASLFLGLQRMLFNNLIDVAIVGLQQFGIIVILTLGGGLVQIAYWFAACFGLSVLTYILISAHLFSWRALIPRYSSEVIRRNLRYSLNMMSVSVLSVVYMQADKLMISKLLPIGVVGCYGFGYSSVSKGQLLTGAVSQAAFPLFSDLYKKGDHSELMSQYRKLQDVVCLATIPLFAIIPFATLPLFTYIFNGEIARMLLLPITFICLGFYMHSTLVVPYFFSLAAGRPEISTKTNFIALFTVLPVTAVLVYFFGLNGAGFSWVFFHVFLYVYAMPIVCKECMNILPQLWFKHVGQIFALVFLTYGLAWCALRIINVYSIFSLAMSYMVATVFFSLGAWHIMGNELRGWVLYRFHIVERKLRCQKSRS